MSHNDTSRAEQERQAIEQCDSVPIHDVGTVQPFGVLLATEPSGQMRVTNVSANVDTLIGVEPAQLLGRPIEDILPGATTHLLRNVAGHSTIRVQREHLGEVHLVVGSGRAFDAALHRSGDRLLIELQPRPDDAVERDALVLSEAQRISARIMLASSVDDLLDLTVTELRRLSGYDRVKAYRFLPDRCGEIVAESREQGIDSFLGLRFPAWDIPESARKLYVSTPLRVISDVSATQPKILVHDAEDRPLDLSLAALRGTMPEHTLYLANMGVAATLSIPIVVDGDLWGLFAFHHYEPRVPGTTALMACELVGKLVSLSVQHREDSEHARRLDASADVATVLTPDDAHLVGLGSRWETATSALRSLIECDGVALVDEFGVHTFGTCPPNEMIYDLLASEPGSNAASDASITVLEQLPEPDATASPTAGMICVHNPTDDIVGVMFFRDRVSQTLRWAGEASTSFDRTANGLRLSPRGSFEEYRDSVDNRCSPWSHEDVGTARALLGALERSAIAAARRGQERDRLEFVVRELNHRVRNILALVQSLIGQTSKDAVSIDQYASSLEERIVALAKAHNLLTEGEWADPTLHALVDASLDVFRADDTSRLTAIGPAVLIATDLAAMLSLVFHELASNASKYGGLSTGDGRVEITWAFDNDRLRLEWREVGGPRVSLPTQKRFGTVVIAESLAYEFDIDTDLRFDPDGVVCTYVFPPHLATPADADDRSSLPRTTVPVRSGEQHTDPAFGPRVLVVEDDFVISRDVSEQLEQAIDADCVCVPTVGRALAELQDPTHARFSFALLDANLRGEFSGAIAERLNELGVPFAFVTGYGSTDREMRSYAPVEVIQKPVTDAILNDLLKRMGLHVD